MAEQSALAESITADLSAPDIQPVAASETPAADAAPAAQPTPEPTPAPAPVTTQPEHDEKTGSPFFTAMLDEREKRKELEKRLKAIEDEKANSQPEEIPSIQENPEAFAAYQQEQMARATLNLRFDISEETARSKHGDELVQSAMDWGMSKSSESPAFAAEYVKQKNPVEWIVKQHKREKLLSDIGDDPDGFVRKRYAEIAGTAQPNGEGQPAPAQSQQPALQPTPQAPAPSRSLASAPNAGGGVGSVPTHPLAGLDAVFR